MPSKVMTALPYRALSTPPALPGGGVISVKTRGDIPARPRETSVQRMAARQASPARVASIESPRNAQFLSLRRGRGFIPRSYRGQRSTFEPPQHRLRRGNDRERDEEEQQPERNERRGVQVAHRFGEFVGDCRGDRRARREERGGNAVGVADDESDRHGLA